MKKTLALVVMVKLSLVYPLAASASAPSRRGGMLQHVRGLESEALTKKQAAFFENKRICVKRDTTTMPGCVITYWHRNGKPDTKGPAVVTNRLQKIVGAEQHNPIQELAERMRQRADEWQTLATNATARIERVNAALDERREECVEKRDAAVLPSTKAIYQAFIDAIDRIKEKLNAEGN